MTSLVTTPPSKEGGWRLFFADARVFQFAFQIFLLLTGMFIRRFSISWTQVALTFSVAVLTQALCLRVLDLKGVGYKSALITAFGICFFLRADSLWVHPLTAVIAVLSKFVIRFRGKHLFNPSNFGVVAALLLLPGTWSAPGQWGYGFLMAAWCIALGAVVVLRAQRNDISWTFLLFYLGMVGLHVFTRGLEWKALWLQVNGGLLVFTFFMISDPMTIPNNRPGRVVHAALVAGATYLFQFPFYPQVGRLWRESSEGMIAIAAQHQYHAYGLLLALFLLSPTVPLWDRLWGGSKYRWGAPSPA
jgi:Na+-transporting NADH:ubiquinone oxidoreductase subunit NqrB